MSEILERKFKLSERGTNVKTEMVAGLTTFLSCVSIVAINPLILSAAGMDIQGVFWATALSAVIACIWMGLYTNFPLCVRSCNGIKQFFCILLCYECRNELAKCIGLCLYFRLYLYALKLFWRSAENC